MRCLTHGPTPLSIFVGCQIVLLINSMADAGTLLAHVSTPQRSTPQRSTVQHHSTAQHSSLSTAIMAASPERGGSGGHQALREEAVVERSSRGTSPALQSPLALHVPPCLHRALPSGEAATASFVCDALSCWDLEPPSELRKQHGRRVVYTTTGPGDCSVGPPDAAPRASDAMLDPFSQQSLAERAQRAADAAETAVVVAQQLLTQHAGEHGPALLAHAEAAALSARHGALRLQQAALASQVQQAAAHTKPSDADSSGVGMQSALACRTPPSTQQQVARLRSLLLDSLIPAAAGSQQRPTAGSVLRLLREVMRPQRGCFAVVHAGTMEVLSCGLRTVLRRRADLTLEAAALRRCLLQDAEGAATSPPLSDASLAVKAEVLRQLTLASMVQHVLWQQQGAPPTAPAPSHWATSEGVHGINSSASFSSSFSSSGGSTTAGMTPQRSRRRKTFAPLLDTNAARNDLASMARALSCSSLPSPGPGGRMSAAATTAASSTFSPLHRTRSQAVLGSRLSREVSVLARSHVAATSFSRPASPIPALVSPVQRCTRRQAD